MEAQIDVIDDDILDIETEAFIKNIPKKKPIKENSKTNYDGSFYLNVSAKSSSPIRNVTNIQKLKPFPNNVLNFILEIVAGISDVITVLKVRYSWKSGTMSNLKISQNTINLQDLSYHTLK